VTRPNAPAPRFGARPEREGGARRERDDYRRRDDGGKKEGASDDFRPEFRGTFGRARPQQQ
ncbi:hypothetical protein H4S03_002185, partial [Coemansia sp. S3946]